MKVTNTLLTILNIITLIFLTFCTPSGPNDKEILELAKTKFIGSSTSTFLLNIKIEEKKSSRNLSERNDLVIFQ